MEIHDELEKGAIDKNTQLFWHNADNSFSHQYKTTDMILRSKIIHIECFSDTMFSLKHKSTRHYNCCQVFVSDKCFFDVCLMNAHKEFKTALH